jgi:hypothetical protein
MKRSISTIFVALVLMNVMGYYALLIGLQYKNAASWSKTFDEGSYSLEDTRSIKIYQPGSSATEAYARIDGEFEKDGQIFRLIKQRHFKDTFHIVFIRDERGTLIKHALSDYARSFSEKTQEDDNQLIILPNFIREYLTAPVYKEPELIPVPQLIGKRMLKSFTDSYTPTIIHPPQTC